MHTYALSAIYLRGFEYGLLYICIVIRGFYGG